MTDTNLGATPAKGLKTVDCPWPLVRADTIFDLRYGKSLVEAQRRTGTIPVYGTNGQCGWHDTALFQGPGVILGRKGQGPLGVEWCGSDFWVIDTAYCLHLKGPNVHLKYAYYLIKFVGLNHLKDGTSNPTLSRDAFGRQLFPLPPLDVQERLATILTGLDDKIDLNRRMNQTLEALAQGLFRSWFSQFIARPEVQVTVKMLLNEGALSIGDGYRAKNSEMADTGLPFIRAGNVNGGFVFDGADLLGDEALSKAREKVARRGDVVFTSKGTVGRFARVTARTAPCVYSPQLCYWRPLDQDRVNPLFLWHWLRSSEFWAQAAAVKGQTDMADYVNLRDQSRMKISLPPIKAQTEIAQVLAPLDERIDHNRAESRTLAALRNMLLPKLLSGEIRVRDSEAQFAASA